MKIFLQIEYNFKALTHYIFYQVFPIIGSVLYRDDKCDGKEGLGVTADLHFLDKVNVFVGFPCSAGNCSRSFDVV